MQNTTAMSRMSCAKTLPVPEGMNELLFPISGVVWKQFGYQVVD